MSIFPSDVYLIEREEIREERREARRRVMQAAVTGADLDISDLATMRGLEIQEQEDSIFNEAWIIIASIILIIGPSWMNKCSSSVLLWRNCLLSNEKSLRFDSRPACDFLRSPGYKTSRLIQYKADIGMAWKSCGRC